MNYFGVTKWEQVLKLFEKGGMFEGSWGWLATLRDAEIGDKISFIRSQSQNDYGTLVIQGTLASENGALYLSSSMGPIPLTIAGNIPCTSYLVLHGDNHDLPAFVTGTAWEFEATARYPVFRYDPDKFNLENSLLDVTSVFASFVGANTLIYGAKAAKGATTVGLYTSIISAGKVTFIDDLSPNSIITSYGGLIPIIGGGFSLAALFYDLGFYQTY